MITITKNGNAVLFEFEENQHYLYNGTIEVPLNSLSLVTDESEMFTFKKAATNDIFISARYDDVNMSKSQLIDFYIANMVGSTGGGSESGITSGDVQTMIDTSLEDYYDIDEIDAALSGKADSSAVTESINAAVSGKADTSAVTEAITAAVSGKADSSAVTEEINSAVSGKADSSSVYTKSEVDTALSGKQDTLASGTNIKTINNESLLGSGNIEIQGGGKAIVAGRGIEVTTGETADTVSFSLPISAGTGTNSIIMGLENNIASGTRSFAGGGRNSISKVSATKDYAFAYGTGVNAKGSYSAVFGSNNSVEADGAFAAGYSNLIYGSFGVGFGEHVIGNNEAETSLGKFNATHKASTTFGDSGNTLFSVGNGTSNPERHNAFEIRQNGDIYITLDGQDVKLQDQLGGGGSSYTAGDGIDITNDVISVTGKVETSAFTSYSAATDARISEDEEVTAAALNALNDGKQDTLIAGSGITISGNVISAEGGNLVIELTQDEYDALVDKDPNAFYIITDAQEINISDYYTSAQTQSAINAAVSGKQDTLIAGSGITISGNVISANGGGGSITVDTALDSGSTNPVENRVIYDKFDEVEEVTAAALNALNDNFDGLRLKKLTQAEYEALTVKDNNTLYILVG